MWCFSPSPEKDSHVCSCSSSPSSPVRLSDIYCRSGSWVLSCVIFFNGVVGCSGQYCMLLFFFRFWLVLWTISLGWVRVCSLWCCFPRCWLVVSSSCSPWFSRSGFWWSELYALFHNLRTAPQFADFILFPLPSIFSHLITVFFAARFSGGSPFRYVYYSRFR